MNARARTPTSAIPIKRTRLPLWVMWGTHVILPTRRSAMGMQVVIIAKGVVIIAKRVPVAAKGVRIVADKGTDNRY